MKDAKGHGSEAHGSYQNVSDKPLVSNAARDAAAAHQSMVQKVLANGDTHGAMAHVVTAYDREQMGRSSGKGRYYNPNALGLYLGAVERAAGEIKGGASHGDAINNNFNGPLANRLHKALKTGGRDVDSQRRETFK